MVHHGADTENPVTEMDENLPATVFIPRSMLDKMGIYSDSPILIKTKKEFARLYRTMRSSGIKVETNALWRELKKVQLEDIDREINFLISFSERNK